MQQISLVNSSEKISFHELQRVAAALNAQISEDFGPAWGLSAHVSVCEEYKDIPSGSWWIEVMDSIDEPGAAGFHTLANGTPYALVEADKDWSVTVSHECLEMIGDPLGNALMIGLSPRDSGPAKTVQYLKELCDPPENFSYVKKGVNISDFLLPPFYQAHPAAGASFSFGKNIPSPFTIAEGGYITFLSDGNWYQQTWFDGTKPEIVSLGTDKARPRQWSYREFIDRATNHRVKAAKLARAK